MRNDSENPYIGPNTFTRDQSALFFGRDREERELLSLVLANRITLFYAQSGAGKSSLINTRIIPNLGMKGFEVLPIGRVSSDIETVEDVDNIFVFNLMLHLDEGKKETDIFNDLKLADFLVRLNKKNKHFYYDDTTQPDTMAEDFIEAELKIAPRVLIIDQFEEIFTKHPEAWHKRGDFFDQLQGAMDYDPYLWVILTLREEHIAALDSHAFRFPNRLVTRYYMERLDFEAALEAVRKPVESKRPFDQGVAEELVDYLRMIKDPSRPKDDNRFEIGQYIEPVYLQVVCYQLWENIKESQRDRITQDDLTHLAKGGDLAEFVNNALAAFYEDAIANVLENLKNNSDLIISERKIRNWFSTELINQNEFRRYIYQEQTETAGLPNKVVSLLLEQFILRSDRTSRGIGIELIHDRFVSPILKANQVWESKNLYPALIDAEAWESAGNLQKMLYKGTQLEAAEEYFKNHPNELTNLVRSFLEKGRILQERERRRLIWIGVSSALIFIVVIFTSWMLQAQKNLQRIMTAATLEAELRQTADDAVILVDLEKQVAEQALDEAEQARDEAEQAAIRLDYEKATAVAAENEAILQKNLAESAQQDLVTAIVEISLQSTAAAQASDEVLRRSQIAELIAQAQYNLNKDTSLALLLSIEAYRKLDTTDTRDMLLRSIQSQLDRPVSLAVPALPFPTYFDGTGVDFSPDGSLIGVGTFNGEVLIWDPSSGITPEPLGAHGNEVQAVTFSPDGKVLATGGFDGVIKLWDVVNREEVASFRSNRWILDLDFSQDGNNLISSGTGLEERIFIWDISDLENPRLIRGLSGPQDSVRMAMLSPDRTQIAAVGEVDDRFLWIWDMKSEYPKSQIPIQWKLRHPDAIWSLAWSQDGNMLATGDKLGNIYLWDVKTGNREGELFVNKTEVIGLAFSPDGNTLISVNRSGVVGFWDIEGKRLIQQNQTIQSVSAAFSPNLDKLALGSVYDSVSLWNLLLEQPLRSVSDQLRGPISGLALVEKGSEITNNSLNAVVNTGKEVEVWKGTRPGVEKFFDNTFEKIFIQKGNFTSVALSTDAKTIALGQKNGAIVFLDITTGDKLNTITDFSQSVTNLDYSRDNTLLAFIEGDRIGILDVKNNKLELEFQLPISDVKASSIAISPFYLAIGYANGDLQIMDINNFTLNADFRRLQSQKGAITSLEFAPDGILLISGSEDKTIHIWDLSNFQTIGESLIGATGGLTSLSFDSSGKWLFSGELDGTIALWDLDPSSWVNKACDLADRNLTMDEWKQFMPEEVNQISCHQ